MAVNANQCWICGNIGNSREHIIKRSDIKYKLGIPSNSKPLYLRTGNVKSKRVFGLNAEILTWENKICANCNNKVTAPYDKAWSKLSDFLSKFPAGLSALNLQFIYGVDYKTEVKNLQLYLIKVLGFALLKANAKISLKDFSACLLNSHSSDSVYITIAYYENWPIEKMLKLTDLHTVNDRHGVATAMISILIGGWQISVTYWLARSPKVEVVKNGFYPNQCRKIVRPVIFKE